MLKCGFYEVDITPAITDLMPGQFEVRPAPTILDNLYAHAFAVACDEETAIIITLDSIAVEKQDADAIRMGISLKTNIAIENISVSGIHNHTGGPVTTLYNTPRSEEYCKFLIWRAINAGIMSFQRLSPARIGCESVDVNGISFNRRYRLKNGTTVMNPGALNPEIDCGVDIIDPELLTVRVDYADGTPMGVIANFALHLDCVGDGGYSADYPSVIRRDMQRNFGENFGFIFLTGTCGNINHLDVTTKKQRNYLDVGMILSNYISNSFSEIKTYDVNKVKCVSSFIDCAMRRPTQEEADAQINPLIKKEMEIALTMPNGTKSIELWSVRIGEVAISMIPGEVFAVFGLDIKKRSKFKYTLIGELANASIGYIYTSEAQKQGGYEVTPSSYICMSSETGYKIADEVAKQLEVL